MSDSSQEHLDADDEILYVSVHNDYLSPKFTIAQIWFKRWKVKAPYLQSSGHGLHAVPVPGVLVGDHTDLHQEGDDDSLPEERKAFVPSGRSKRVTWLIHTFLPKGDKHHQFDTQELSHRPNGSQLFF